MKKHKKRRSQRNLIHFLLVLLWLSAILCIGMVCLVLRSQHRFRQQAVQVHSTTTQPTTLSTETLSVVLESTAETTMEAFLETTAAVTEPEILPEYQQMYDENPETFGWLRIPNTRIDYPVMHTPADPEKYIYKNFQQEYSFAGTPFMDGACNAENDNQIIYAHNMLDGSMFRSLLNYQQKDYWQRHPVITFDTLYEKREYEVVAAFYDRVYYKRETVFKFYQFINAQDKADYDNAIQNFKAKALYDTGITAEYGDQLVTLVTCAYHTDNGRFVVVARKIA